MRRTQVAIIGGGPAGLLLSHLLHQHRIDSVVIERQTKAYVLKRIRPAVLEFGSVQVLRDSGAGERMDREGHAHDGGWVVWQDRDPFLIDTKSHTGKPMWSHGQTAITEELYRIRERDGGRIVEEAENVQLHALTTSEPKVTFEKGGVKEALECDFIAGCDGFHGVSRQSIPKSVLRIFERAYPFGWLGVMSETPPVGEVIYARHERGFALASLRNPMLSRYLHPVHCRYADRRLAGREVLGRAQAPLSRRYRSQDRDRPVDRKVDRPIAQLRRRADALRPVVSRRRRSAHRAPYRSERPQPRDLRRLLFAARVCSALFEGRRPLSRNYSDMALRRVWASEVSRGG